jgi:hypothetical protein
MVLRFPLALLFAFLSTLSLLMATSLEDAFMPIVGMINGGKGFDDSFQTLLIFMLISLAITSSIQAFYALTLTALSKVRGASSSLAWFPLCGTISVWVLDSSYTLVKYGMAGLLRPIVMVATFAIIVAALIQSLWKVKSSN